MFRVKKPPRQAEVLVLGVPNGPPFAERALPPLPDKNVPTLIAYTPDLKNTEESAVDFASSIEKVKDVSNICVLI